MKTLRRYRTSLGGFMTALVAIWQICSPVNLRAATSTWLPTTGGTFNWNDVANWTGGIPVAAAGNTVNLNTNVTTGGDTTINLDINAILGTLRIGDPTSTFSNYTLQTLNSQTLTFDNLGGGASIIKAASAGGNDVISVNTILAEDLLIQNDSTVGTLTLSGNISETGGPPKSLTIQGTTATAPASVIVLSGTNSFTGNVTVGGAVLRALGTGSLNASAVNTINIGGGALDLRADGNNMATPEDIDFRDNISMSTSGTILVSNINPLVTTTARNKTLQLNDLQIGAGATLTVTPTNNYGLEFKGITTLDGPATFNVGGTQASNAVPGLTLTGVVTSGTTPMTKSGSGTMVLANALNDFGGVGYSIDITSGVLEVASNGALGNSANGVNLNGSAVATLRASGTFSTGRVISLTSATAGRNAIEVTTGNTLTLTSAFGLPTLSNTLVKNDNGILVLSVSNPTWTGSTTINSGIVRIQHNTALGTAGAFVSSNSAQGGALQLDGSSVNGNLTITRPISIGGTTGVLSGVNSGGTLDNYAGNNTLSGMLTLAFDASVGAAAGSTLNLTGGITTNGHIFNIFGAGNVNITTTNPTATPFYQINKYGSGTTTWSVGGANSATSNAGPTVHGGTFIISGTNAAIIATNWLVDSGARLKVDDSGTAFVNRLGNNKAMALSSGTFEYQVNGTGASSETIGVLTASQGANVIQVDTTGQNSTLTFASLTQNFGSTLLFKAGGTGLAFGGATNKVLFTAVPTLTSPLIGIIQRGIVIDANGTNFATYNNTGLTANTNGIQALTSYNIPVLSSTTVTGVDTTVTVASTAGLSAGMAVYGPTVSAGATIGSIISPTQYTIIGTITGGAANQLLAYGNTSYTDINNINSLLSTGDNAKFGTGFVTNGSNISGATRTFNSLYLSGPGTTINSGAGNGTFTVTSGGILSTGAGTNTIGSGAIIAFGGVEGGINVDAGNTLAVNGTFTSSTHVTKGLDGNLTFNGKQYFNTGANYFTINGGTVTLNGGNNTLFPGVQGGTAGSYLSVGPGATLDLNGTAQLVGDLRSPNNNAFVSSGGTITSLSGAGTLVNAGGVASNWGGQITGNVFFAKGGTNAFNIYNDQTFTGGLLLMGGTTQLIDSGKFSGLSGSTPININFGNLTISNTGTLNDFDRIPDAAAINSYGASITFNGRAQTVSTETLGVLTLLGGAGQITIAAGGTGVNSAELIFSGFNTAGVDGTINLNQNSAIGSTTRISFLSAPTTINGVTPQFEFGGGNLATYIPGVGLAQIDAAGGPGYSAITTLAGLGASGPATAIQNVRLTAGGTIAAGGLLLNSLHLNSLSVNFTNDSDVLNLTAGVLFGTGTFSLGATVDNGRLTASNGALTPAAAVNNANGNVPLYVYTGSGTRTINSRIVDPNAGANLRLIISDYNGAFVSLTNGLNSYSGGTVVNGWTGNAPTSSGLRLEGGVGQVVVPAGGLTLNHAIVNEVTNGGQIHSSTVVTLNGGSNLNLVQANTLDSLVFNNIGGISNPSVATGGVLSLTNATPISVILPSNPSTVATVSGTLDFGNVAKSIYVDPTTINGESVAPLTAGLNITALIQNSGLITKTGNGNLQLTSTTSTFTGGINLSAGGLIIGASSTASARPDPNVAPVVTSGPLGTGTLTIANGTRLLSSAANTIGNQIVIGGNFEFDGLNNLTLNGDASLGNAMRTISVNAPQMTATLGGIVSGTGAAGIIKDGYGTLVLSNVNTFTGGITLNGGTLVGIQPVGVSSTGNPFGSGAITYNGGTLSMRAGIDAIFGNNINVNTALTSVNLDVQSTSGPNTIRMGDLNLPTSSLNPTVALVNVTGGTTANPSTLVVTTSTLGLNNGSTSGSRVAGQYQTFNIAANTTLAITSGGFERNNEALNVGLGTLLLGGSNNFTDGTTITTSNAGAAPTVGAVNAVYGTGAVTINNGVTYTIAPQMGAITVGAIPGATTGGLQQTFTNVSGGGGLSFASNWGLAPGSVFNGVQPNDTSLDRVIYTNPNFGLAVYNGYLNITTGGTYSFIIGSDDNSSLVIDGVEVARDNPGGHAVQDTARGTITLAAGQHTITMKVNAGTGQAGGGSRLLYSGPDTATNGGNNGYMAVPSSALSYFTGPASLVNNYYNAAQIDNDYIVAAAATATLQGLGTDFNSTLKSLSLGNGSTLNITNDLGTTGAGGTGFMGIIGTTTLGTGATLNPTTGTLYLIGGISDGGNGLIKTGLGTLALNNSSAFSGTFAINAGTVRIFEANALSTGSNTVASGASLDLNGTASSSGRNVTINGVGTVSQFGALYNSSANTGSLAGTLTLGATAATIAGYGDIIVSGAITGTTLLTKTGPNTLTLSGNNTAMTGGLVISGGVVNNGTLNSGATTALGGGAGTITANANSVLNLSGNGTDRSITTNGTSITNRGPNQNSLGNIINSSLSSSYSIAAAPAPGSAFMKQANTANTATLAGNITMNTATLGMGSNTFATGGDIIVTGNVTGGQALTKVGGNTVTLRSGSNNYTGGTNVNYGTLKLDTNGIIAAAGGGTITVQTGASLVIDNAGTAVQNRLNNATGSAASAANKSLILNGGTFTINGNASTGVTETTLTGLTTGNSTGISIGQGQNYINLVNNGANVTLSSGGIGTGGALLNAGGGTLLITGKNLGAAVSATSTNLIFNTTGTSSVIGQTGANGVNTKGITPWAIVNADAGSGIGSGTGTLVSFMTLDSATPTSTGVRALAASEYATALTASTNVNFTTALSAAINANTSVNSLTFATGVVGSALTLQQGTTFNIQSGGILATASNTISGTGIINADGGGATQNLYVHTFGSGTTLTIDATLGYSSQNSGRLGEVVKAGAGTLVLGGNNFYTTNTRIQEGTLRLNSDQAIYYRQTAPATSSNFNSSNAGPTLQINQGATLDMNNRDLTVNNFNSINPAGVQGSLSGGTVINSVAGTKNFVINTTTNNTWSGNISSGAGVINFSKYGRSSDNNGSFSITNENTYTGTTIIGGGSTILVDVGALRGTSSVTINAAGLNWFDNGSQADAYRLGAVPADVIFNGGGFQFSGRGGAFSVANLGDVTLASGANQITSNAQLYGNATIQMATFTRNTGAVVNFNGSVLGDDGNIKVTGGVTNYNGMVGGWAISSATNPYLGYIGSTAIGAGSFVEYDAATGFRAIVDFPTTGVIDYASGTDRPALGNAAFGVNKNVRVNSNTTLAAGNNVANSMVIGLNATTTLTFAAPADTLFIQSGGILGTTDANTKAIGATVAGGGKITAGNSDGSAGLGNPNYDLYLHNLGNTMTVNAQIVNNGANAVNLVTSTGSLNGPIIRLSNTNTYTGTTTVNATDLRLASTVGTTLANSTSIFIVGGNETNGNGGITSSRQAMSRILFENAGSQLNSGATVNIINNATLDTNNFDQTLANIVFNNTGGHSNDSSGVGGSVRSGSGTITLTGSITATNLTNTSVIPFILGNLDLNGGQRTVTVDAITGAGVQGAAQVGLSIFADMSNGGINKEGAGVLAITGVSTYTGPTNVNNGTLVLGGRDQQGTPAAITASLQGSLINVAVGATVDMRGGNAIIGSLGGTGTVTNSVYATHVAGTGVASTLTIGADNTSTADFSGRFTNFINGISETTGYTLNITKIGTGIQTISGDNALSLSPAGSNGDINNVGILDIQEGTILVNGANGSLAFATINVKAGASLTLDNSVDNKANRLGGYRFSDSANGDVANDTGSTRAISMQGGTIVFKEGTSLTDEGTSAALSMTSPNKGVGNVTLTSGSSTWLFDYSEGNAGVTINVNQMNAGAGSLHLNAGVGQSLGQVAAGVNSINVYVNGITVGGSAQGSGTIGSIGAVLSAGTGVQGNVVGGIRSDITATDNLGTGFVTYDRYGYRLLTSAEYSNFPTQPDTPLESGAVTPTNPPANWAAVNPTITPSYTGNARVSTAEVWTTNTTVLSLRLDSGGGLTSAGGAIPAVNSPTQLFNALGSLNTLTVTSGSIIGNTGNTGFTGGAIAAPGTGTTLRITAAGDINSSSYLINGNVGTAFVKDGTGTLNQTRKVFLGSSTDQGATFVNNGILQLNAGPNTLAALNTANVSAVDSLTVNVGGTVNLMGNDQVVASIASADVLPGGGGIITSSGAANLFTNSSSTFAGSINGAINLYKTGTNNLTLTSSNGYTGTTNVQGGILVLQDSGTLASTTFNLNGGQLRFENRNNSLSDITARISTTSTLNMRGGTLLSLGRAGVNATENIATVNAIEGFNVIQVDAGAGGARGLNIDTLNVTAGAQVHFTTGLGTLGATGANPSIYFDAIPTTINGVIPWAVASTDQIAMYNSTINPLTGGHYGVAVPNVTGGAFTTANYQDTQITSATTGENVNQGTGAITEATTVTDRVFNSFRFSSNTGTTVALGTAELVRLEAGVLISNGGTGSLSFSNGRITAGAATNTAAMFYSTQIGNTTTMNTQIVDNGTGMVTLVKGGTGALALNPSFAVGISAAGAGSNATIAGGTTITIAAAPTTPVAVGDAVTGPGIPNGAVVTAILSTTSFTISAPAFATTSGGNIGFGGAQVITGTNAAAATTINISNALAANLFAGASVTGAGVTTTISTIGAADSGGAGLTAVTIASGTGVTANQILSYASAANVSTNSGYTGSTIVNTGTLALNGAVGSRSLGGGSLTINNGGAVTMTNAGQIAPNTDLTINGGGSLVFTPVTTVSPATGGINVLNSVTFNNNGGTAVPTVNIGGATAFLTIKSGLVTSTNDNQGSTPLISNGILNFGQIALGTATSTTTVQVADIAGFVVGQTVTGLGISAGTTIQSITGNVLTLTGGTATSGLTGSISTVNQAAGSIAAIAPTLNVTTSTVNKLTADLQISAVIANSTVGGAGIGGWSNLANGGGALVKTGNGNLSLTGTNTFDNGFNLNEGQVTVGNVAAFGTGTLSIAGGTQLQTDGTARTITNAININGDFTFGGQQAGHNITQTTGGINLGAGVRNITVSSPLVTATLGGVISNGGLTKSGDGILALNGANTYAGGTIINAGLVVAGNASALGANTNDLTVKAGATLNMNGFALTVDGLNGDDAILGGLITNTGGAATLTVGNNAEARATFAGVITNTANAISFTKVGAGTQVLAGVNTYTGPTTISNGILLANNTAGSATGSGSISVGATGTLGGTGNVGLATPSMTVTVASGGVLSPGDSLTAGGRGTLSVTGNVTLAAAGGSVLELQISHTNGVNGYFLNPDGTANWAGILGAAEVANASDHLNISGALTTHTSGTTTLKIGRSDLGGFAGGMAWDLVDWGTISNPAANYTLQVDVDLATELASAGMALDITRFKDTGYVALVPEPSRMLLLMFGLMALFFRRRRSSSLGI